MLSFMPRTFLLGSTTFPAGSISSSRNFFEPYYSIRFIPESCISERSDTFFDFKISRVPWPLVGHA